MDIPLLNKEDVEKEGDGIGITIRDDVIEFLKSKGYKYVTSEDGFGEETNDFFTKDDQLVHVIISNEIPDEISDLIEKEESEKKELRKRLKIKTGK